MDIAIEGTMNIEAMKIMSLVIQEVEELFDVDEERFGAFPFSHEYVVSHEGGYLVERTW